MISATKFPTRRTVDISVFNVLSENFDPTGANGPSSTWNKGNFDGDVDITDFNGLSSNFAPGGYGAASGQILEPTTIALCI
jgi:hypothetical protein